MLLFTHSLFIHHLPSFSLYISCFFFYFLEPSLIYRHPILVDVLPYSFPCHSLIFVFPPSSLSSFSHILFISSIVCQTSMSLNFTSLSLSHNSVSVLNIFPQPHSALRSYFEASSSVDSHLSLQFYFQKEIFFFIT